MSKASSIRSLTCNPLAPLVLVLWLMASGFCCPLDFNPGSCQCKPFGHHRIRIECRGITHLPRNLPPNTTTLDLSENMLKLIPEKAFQNLTRLISLDLSENMLKLIPEKAFQNLTRLTSLDLSRNMLKLIPEKAFQNLTRLTSLDLSWNMLKLIPENAFQNLASSTFLDLSRNMLKLILEKAFQNLASLLVQDLSGNMLKLIPEKVFQNLTSLGYLDLSLNNLRFIPVEVFSGCEQLETLFLHGNRIKQIADNAFNHLKKLEILTLFSNPIETLQNGTFKGVPTNVQLLITCKSLRKILPEAHNPLIQCAPSPLTYSFCGGGRGAAVLDGLVGSECYWTYPNPNVTCYNCSFCSAGTYGNSFHCSNCPKGGFYQDEMGQTECKNCSTGTYVPEKHYPGKSATDCRACPYGTRTDDSAGYRACNCLSNFYRMDRFGPCTACSSYGIDCENDTAILAPNYFWKWNSTKRKENYTEFVINIHTQNGSYDKAFSTFEGPLPKPVKCPYPDSCKGGINSTCNTGYQGILCAACSSHYYHRFNRCLRCPKMLLSIISSCVVIFLFVLLFLIVFWGDSRRTEGNRTVADVVMSCIKIVIGFYQVLAGIFSALLQVRWPVILLSMTKYLNFVEGNILQFAPLSCIHPVFRLDPFIQFVLAISLNVLVISLILLYLFVKKQLVNRKDNSSERIENFILQNNSDSMYYSIEENSPERMENCTGYTMENSKTEKLAQLKKSCYRNIFLFLLLSYPVTSMKIINILPLPGVCVNVCFTNDDSDCSSFLKAD